MFSNFSGTAEAVYEILKTDAVFDIEQLQLPVIVLDVGGVGLGTLVNSSVTVLTASATAPVPCFAEPKSSPVAIPPPNCP